MAKKTLRPNAVFAEIVSSWQKPATSSF